MDSTLVIIDKINSIYSSTLTHIEWMLGILMFIWTILIPFAYYFFQRRLFKLKVGEINATINERFDGITANINEKINTIKDALNQKFNDYKNTINEKLKKEITMVNTQSWVGIDLISGILEYENKNYKKAFNHYLNAGEGAIVCEDYQNLKITLHNLELVIDKLISQDLTDVKSLEINFNNFINSIKKLDDKNILVNEIEDIEINFNKIKTRTARE